jgi:hypothetical protein
MDDENPYCTLRSLYCSGYVADKRLKARKDVIRHYVEHDNGWKLKFYLKENEELS